MAIAAPTILDLMEYANDAAAQAAYVTNGAQAHQQPSAHSATYVKATSSYTPYYYPYDGTDPARSVIGADDNNAWLTALTNPGSVRFHIDFGSGKAVNRLLIENGHNSGGNLTMGMKNFTIWGSNTAAAFAELTYGIDTNWTQLGGTFQAAIHSAVDQSEPQYFDFTNITAYRYMAIKVIGNWGHAGRVGFRRATFMFAQSLQDYSETTIKQEGSYAIKGMATVYALNKTLTRTVSPVVNLTDKTIIKFDIRASRTGSNIKISIHDSGGTTIEITPNILAADTWQTVVWDISAVSNANKDAIDSIIVTIVNADAANTFYIDNMFGDTINNYLTHRGRDRFRTAGYSLGN